MVADIRKIVRSISPAALARAISSRDFDRVFREVKLAAVTDGINARVGIAFERALKEGGKLGAKDARVTVDLGKDRIDAALAARGGALVKDLGDTGRAGIRGVVRQGWAEGKLPGQIAEDLTRVVGLNEGGAMAVARRRAKVIESGATPAQANKRADRYAASLLKRRAEVIARNEVMIGLNDGRQALWEQLQADGALEPGQMKEWLTADDERVCPICGPADGQTKKLSEPFELSNGETMNPPAHTSCRCTVVLV